MSAAIAQALTPRSYILPPNGKASPESVSRKRKMAEAMMASGMDASPVGHWTQGAARVAQSLMGGLSMRKAEREEQEGRESARDMMTKALMGGDKMALLEASQHPFMSAGGQQMIGQKWGQMNQPPPDPLEVEHKRLQNQKLQNDLKPKPEWTFVPPVTDEWGGIAQPGYWADKNSPTAPQPPQRQQQGATEPPNLATTGDGEVFETTPEPTDMRLLAQQYLPGVSPKIIMGNQDLQEFLASKASNPEDTRTYPEWDADRRKSGAGNVTINNDGAPQVGTIPQGWELYKDPQTGSYSMRPIVGGPEDKSAAKAIRDQRQGVSTALVLDEIAAAKELIKGDSLLSPRTGISGKILSNIDSTAAGALKNRLETIKANIGFDRLQAMREASPTGGALGPVSDFENRLLQAVMGSLEQAQSAGQIQYNLERLERIYDQVVNRGIPDDDARRMYKEIVTGRDGGGSDLKSKYGLE